MISPNVSISAYAHLLESGAYGELLAKQKDVGSRIRQAEERLLLLVEQVVGFARAGCGPELRSKLFTFKQNLNGGRLGILADYDSLQQIIVSLVSNASKCTRRSDRSPSPRGRKGEALRFP